MKTKNTEHCFIISVNYTFSKHQRSSYFRNLLNSRLYEPLSSIRSKIVRCCYSREITLIALSSWVKTEENGQIETKFYLTVEM